jgi:hypothetical protein
MSNLIEREVCCLFSCSDPKRIQRRLRTTQNSQKQLNKLRMALADREREKIQSPQKSEKMESL